MGDKGKEDDIKSTQVSGELKNNELKDQKNKGKKKISVEDNEFCRNIL